MSVADRDQYEVQEVRIKDRALAWWVIRIPEKGRRVRVARYPNRAQAEAHRAEAEWDEVPVSEAKR